jgi:uncharacterized protein
MNNPVGWFEIYVNDMPRAKKFYEQVFAKPLSKLETPVPDIEMWAFPMDQNAGGAAGSLVKMKDMGPRVGGTLIYFSCSDCAVEADKATKAGGKIEQAKMSIGEYGYIAMVMDTEGNLIGLHSMK